MMVSSRVVLAFAAPLLPSVLAADRIGFVPQEHSWYKDYYTQPDQYCFIGCRNAVNGITYNVVPAEGPLDYSTNQCSNTPSIKSMYLCSQKYCTYEQSVAGRRLLNDQCEFNAGITLPTIDDWLVSDAELAQVLILNATDAAATATDPLNTTAIPDAEYQAIGVHTESSFYLNWSLSWNFSFSLIAYWGLVVLVGIVYRVAKLLKKPSETRQAGWWIWVRRKIILPATFNRHQAEAVGYTYTIPPRLETLLLTLFLIINITYCFPGFDLFAGGLYYPEPNLALARYIADRTGMLAIALLPMVWVFASRNDPLMWLTGWSFATFNRFHRWIARIAVFHAISHSIAWTLYEIIAAEAAMMPKYSYYVLAYADEYFYMGVIATVLMSLMIPASMYYFRERFYDLFLIVHIALATVILVAMWYHVRIFDGEFAYFLWPCIAIWSVDRLLRAGRTIYTSVLPRFSKGVKATATYHRTTEIIRLDITDFLPTKPIIPGHYYYLYTADGFHSYESHPFTLCSWRRPGGSGTSSPAARSLNDKDLEAKLHPVSESGFACMDSSDHAPGEVAHTFLIRPYKGMTGRMHKKLLANHESVSSAQETVFLEGPYGNELDLSRYSDVLVICGGSGITAAISHAHFLTHKNPTTRVHIVWAVPQRHLPDDICVNELASVINTDRVNMRVYLTNEAEKEAHDPEKLPSRSPYEIRLGRPDIEEVMREYRAKATKSIAVVTCGTPQMSDICRKAAVTVLAEDGVDLGYYNETLLW